MNRFSSHVEGPRWAHVGQAIEIYGQRTGTDVKTVVTKGFLRERIDFTITGSDEEIERFNRWLMDSLQEYNND